MAKEIGAFEKYGLNADLIYIASGPVVLQALIGGDLTVGLGASNSTVAAALRGAPVIAVGCIINKAYHRLFVQPDINRIEDLRGKTLGVTRFGSVTDNLTQILLRKYNLEGKVNVRQMGGVIEVGAAFQQKLIAGAVSSELRTSEQHPAKILIKLIDLGVPYSMDMIAPATGDRGAYPARLHGGNRSAASAKRKSPESHRKVRPSRRPEKN